MVDSIAVEDGKMNGLNLFKWPYGSVTYYGRKVNIKMHKDLIFLLFP